MDRTLLNITFYNMLSQVLVGVLFFVYSKLSLNQYFQTKKMCILFFVYSPPYSILGAVLYKTGFMHKYEFQVNLGLIIVNFFFLLILCKIIFGTSWYISSTYTAVFIFVLDSTREVAALFQQARYNLSFLNDFIHYVVTSFLFAPCIALLVFWLLSKVSFPYLLNTALKSKNNTVLGILSGCMCFIYSISSLLLLNEYSYSSVALYSILWIIFFLGFIQYLTMYESSLEKLKAKDTLLLHQQSYMAQLESMQKEMQGFRHDYKNMLSSMYLYAKNGQQDKVKDFIEHTLNCMDLHITDELRLTSHLAHIQILELKSLLLLKLAAMRKNNITCHLEINHTVDQISMDIDDFCRCIGIIIDNAMEEMAQQSAAAIDIIILGEGKITSFLISNPLFHKTTFHLIGSYGYSTKGKNRGLGLYNYHKILCRYDHVFSATYEKNNCFIQELNVKE